MKSTIFLVLLIYIHFGILTFETEPGDSCEDEDYPDTPLFIHANKDGLSRCCVNIECGPGTEARLCEDLKPDSTSCIICKPGTFQSYTTESVYMRKCQLHTYCHQDAVVYHPGSATTDVVCICNLQLGYYGSWPDCVFGNFCEPGQQLRLNGTCEKCPPNSYQITKGTRPCSNCSGCDLVTQEVANNCSAVSDTKCRNKTSGYYPDGIYNTSEVKFVLLITFGVLGVLALVIAVPVIVICCPEKFRIGGNAHTRASLSSGSSSPSETSSEPSQVLYQRNEDRSKQEVLEENLNQHFADNTRQEAEHLRRSSLCQFDAILNMPNSDFGDLRSGESEGLLSSPSGDTSHVVASVSLMDERQIDTGRENSPPSVLYEVETAVSTDQRIDSVPFRSHGETVMNGKCNVKQGNVYNFKNCRDIKIVHRK